MKAVRMEDQVYKDQEVRWDHLDQQERQDQQGPQAHQETLVQQVLRDPKVEQDQPVPQGPQVELGYQERWGLLASLVRQVRGSRGDQGTKDPRDNRARLVLRVRGELAEPQALLDQWDKLVSKDSPGPLVTLALRDSPDSQDPRDPRVRWDLQGLAGLRGLPEAQGRWGRLVSRARVGRQASPGLVVTLVLTVKQGDLGPLAPRDHRGSLVLRALPEYRVRVVPQETGVMTDHQDNLVRWDNPVYKDKLEGQDHQDKQDLPDQQVPLVFQETLGSLVLPDR